ncbi:MAG: guanylate kinase, partial [Pseudomonadota bacterium]
AGLDVLFDIDWQGAQQIQGSVLRDHVLSIFLLPPSISELRRRLINRAKDSDDTIQRRMQKSWDEISHWGAYDYVLINDDLDVTEQSLRTIIASERLRSKQQPGLVTYVRGLQEEFEDGE